MTDEADDTVVEDAAAVEAAVLEVEQDLQALLAERDSYKDIAQRLQADFDNYRKRMANQQADEVQRATGKLAKTELAEVDAWLAKNR